MPSATRKLSCLHCSTKRHFDLHQATLQFAGTISWARYPGWCPFVRSNKSTSHSTRYRTPLGVFLAAITVPTLRSTIARGVLTHTLSPGLTFFIYSPPSERSAHACAEFRVGSSFRRASPDYVLSWPTVIASLESRCLEDMEGLVWLGVICIEGCGILEGCRFSLAHSGTITALNSSWTVTPLFFASEDISANGFSFILSMNLGTVKALPNRSARS